MSKAILFLVVTFCFIQASTNANPINKVIKKVKQLILDPADCAIGQPHITYNDYFGTNSKGQPGWRVSVVAKAKCTDQNLRVVLSDGTTITPSLVNEYSSSEKSYSGWAYFFQIPLSTTATTWTVVTDQGSTQNKLGPFKLPQNKPTRAFKPSKWVVVADMDASEYSKSTFDRLNIVADRGYDGVIHNGDFAYNVHTSNGKVGDDYFNAFSKISSRLPYIVTPGNHEYFDHFQMFNYRFQMPGAANGIKTVQAANYYSFVLNGVYFATINWDYVFGDGVNRMAEVFNWFSNDLNLQKRNADIRYKVFFTHKPFYCTFAEVDCLQYYLFKPVESLLYKHNFDLILNSHIHLYYRHKKTDKNLNIVKTDNRLPLYFISGHQGVDPARGGNKQTVPDARKGRLEVVSKAGLPNYLALEFFEDSIRISLKDCITDVVLDSAEVTKTSLKRS